MKKPVFKYILIISFVLFLLCYFLAEPRSYPFVNKNVPIKSIELLYYPWAIDMAETWMDFQQIRVLEQEEIPGFMNAIYGLQTKRAKPSPPLSNYGPYIARVTYKNGDVEYFGSRHIEFVENGQEAYAVGLYYFPGDTFEKLFLEYAGDWQNIMSE